VERQNLRRACWEAIAVWRLRDGTPWTKSKPTAEWAREAFPAFIFSIIDILERQKDMGRHGKKWPRQIMFAVITSLHAGQVLPPSARVPYFIGSVGLLYGFLSGYLKQIHRLMTSKQLLPSSSTTGAFWGLKPFAMKHEVFALLQ